MRIELEKIGKRYHRDWIFRNVDLRLESGEKWSFLGANGSGKSTLMKVISGYTLFTEGQLNYFHEDQEIAHDRIYSHLTIAAPYLDLAEDMTLEEAYHFHQQFKPFPSDMTFTRFADLLDIHHRNNSLAHFSSGMRQRVKLALAIISDTPLVFLDEPCTNLDLQGIAWYHQLVQDYGQAKCIIVCTNRPEEEAPFAEKSIRMTDYK